MPGKGDGASPRADENPSVRYHIPGAEEVRRTARRVLRSGRATYPSQVAFRDAVVAALRRDDPLAVVGGTRLRRLILETPGVRLSVHYTERPDLHPLLACPVCGSELKPVKNRTLTGDSVVLGQECTRCDYWTHRQRRVPVRYTFSRGGGPRVREPRP
ncbi:MAG TPA: hypothetical protein VK424_08530 [Thermoplasmata archaeon]|nr:hypothetical protein [Thermoplasmata archaeon]